MLSKFYRLRTTKKLVRATAELSTKVLKTTSEYIELELAKSAHNYHPIPKVLNKGLGCYVWDVEGKVLILLLEQEK